MTPCMGGMCKRREQCPHYRDGDREDPEPAERLCERGHDGVWIINADPWTTRRINIFETPEAA
jgi:hypothetical protein